MGGIGIAALVMALASSGAAIPLRNMDFEDGELGQAPPGWSSPAAMGQAGYHAEVSGEDPNRGKKVARLWRDTTAAASTRAFGSLAQSIDIATLRGHRIRYSAAVRVTQPSSHIGLWLRVDAPGGEPAFFDNMQSRPITGSGWAVYAIEGYVPAEATGAVLGLLVTGDGDASIDSAALEDLGPAEGAPTGEAKVYLDHVLGMLEKEHINSAGADWPKLRADAYKRAGGATTPGQTHAAIRGVIASLGERHTFLRPPMPARPPGAPRPADVPMPTGRMQGGVAVMALPRLSSASKDDDAAYEAAITGFLKGEASKACGWVVDLRTHGGGNMWPGMRGLGPLFGEGAPGVFVNKAGRKPWPAVPPAAGQGVDHPDAPVAVLLGPRTASAGEMIAIGFAGRPASRSFGQPTAGLTTANSSFPLSDGAMLALTSAYVEDRTGRRYEGPMTPDETTPPDGAEQEALAWLAAQGCR